ncbi:MAG TPA: hypothetical protein VLT33_17280 [Labilithrix sp.]|nr:hypothetical protein [Labilithrix sp.]
MFSCAERAAPPRPPLREVCAPVPPCPSWVTVFRDNRAALHLHVYDGVSGTPACASGQKVHVTAYLDEQSVGEADVPCLDAERTPPAVVHIEGPVPAPGMHELRVDVQTARGVVQGKTLLSLPAFDFARDGRFNMGAEVSVGIGPDDLAIGPPQVYPPAPAP